ncbi:MAG: paraquat-inducible protein A [Nibricoccus sp.]
MSSSSSALLTCPLCGQHHQPVALAAGERALCFRCDTVLARGPRFGRNTTLVFALTGLVLAGPALFLPFITAGKFGQERGGLLFSGVEGLWDHGMRLLSVWVLICGIVAPMILLGILTALLACAHMKWRQRSGVFLVRAAHAVAYWAIPEVQVLAVLVALMKLGSVVHVTIGAGFWFYSGMAVSVLVAWRSFTLSQPVFAPEEMPSNSQPTNA